VRDRVGRLRHASRALPDSDARDTGDRVGAGGPHSGRRADHAHQPPTATTPATPASPAAAWVDRSVVFGHSVRGVALTATEVGDPSLPAVLLVGCIHGNEPAGVAVVDRLLASPPRGRIHLWLMRTLNPDGETAGTRGNAHQVDLNRNFPDAWKPIGPPGSVNYAGPGPLSEPEAAAMAALLRQIHPRTGIWFHQALDVIDISQGPRNVEDALAAALGVPERALTDYPGSAIGFEDQLRPASAFAFELPAGALSQARAAQIAGAILTVSTALA
jgi:protein MpaA